MSLKVPNRPVRIRPALQPYDWGMTDTQCQVAKLTTHTRARLGVPVPFFAEAWFGAHPKGCAVAILGDEMEIPLDELLRVNSDDFLGDATFMPFQAKVLSMKKPLSIQIHPNATRAAVLHAERPKSYPDNFPKHEAGLALTDVELLYGVREDGLSLVPELLPFIGNAAHEEDGERRFKRIWAALRSLSDEAIQQSCQQVYTRLQKKGGLRPEEEWVLKLQKEYPEGDLGVFFCFLLHHLKLKAGEAVEIPTGRFHAYLSGELAEIMLPGDCVIRVGLTPKEKDLDEIERSAEFRPIRLQDTVTGGEIWGEGKGRHYAFTNLGLGIHRLDGRGTFVLPPSPGPRVLIGMGAEAQLEYHDGPTKMTESLKEEDAFLLPKALSPLTVTLHRGTLLCFGKLG